jgi:hypothetical protein
VGRWPYSFEVIAVRSVRCLLKRHNWGLLEGDSVGMFRRCSRCEKKNRIIPQPIQPSTYSGPGFGHGVGSEGGTPGVF